MPGSRVEWVETSGRGRDTVESRRAGTVWAEGPKALSIWVIPEDNGEVVLLAIRQNKETMRWSAKRDYRYRSRDEPVTRPLGRPVPEVDGQVPLFEDAS